MKLYQIVNGIGTYWVVAAHPTEAEEKVLKILNENDYGYSKDRVTKTITPIAVEITDRYLTGKFLIL